MRGKVCDGQWQKAESRITPAYAGKSAMKNHSNTTVSGSPPHVRGKVSARRRLRSETGITPACAGKRLKSPKSRLPTGDHPRICGEKTAPKSGQTKWAGSPPHIRGKECAASGRGDGERITPAYAGKRRRTSACTLPCWDHPRICGEKMNASVKAIELRGSPPHVRGKERHN